MSHLGRIFGISLSLPDILVSRIDPRKIRHCFCLTEFRLVWWLLDRPTIRALRFRDSLFRSDFSWYDLEFLGSLKVSLPGFSDLSTPDLRKVCQCICLTRLLVVLWLLNRPVIKALDFRVSFWCCNYP